MEKVINIIKDLSENVFKKHTTKCDREPAFPTESFNAIKSSGLLSAMIPKENGGFGLTFSQYEQCLIEISKGCPATAAAFNMHNIVIGSISELPYQGLPDRIKKNVTQFINSIYKLVTEKKSLFAAATSEKGVGARFSKVKTSYKKVGNRYIINGTKCFVTMANYADYYVVLANRHDQINSGNINYISYFIIPRMAKGVSVSNDWDTLGMRATSSSEVFFDNVEVEASGLFLGREGFALNKVMKEPHWITGGYLGVYLGVMEMTFDFVVQYLKSRTCLKESTGLGFQPLIQARVAEMYTMLINSRNAVKNAAESVDNDKGSTLSNELIYTAKYLVGEYAPQLSSMAMRTCGGTSIHKKFGLERLLRDSFCCRLMPAVSDVCQLYLGRSVLGINTKDLW